MLNFNLQHVSFKAKYSHLQLIVLSDELSGADHKCHEGLFSCDSGKCIHEDFLCDGKNQCPGEETDELAENCPVKIAPPVAINNKSKAGGLILALLLSVRNQGRRNTIWRFMKLLVINHKTAQIH